MISEKRRIRIRSETWIFENMVTTRRHVNHKKIIQNVVSRSAWTIWSHPTNASILSLSVDKTSVQRRHFPEYDSQSTVWDICPYACSRHRLLPTRVYATSSSHFREKIDHVRPRSVTSWSVVCQCRITAATRSCIPRVQDLTSIRERLSRERCLRHISNVSNLCVTSI